MSDGVIFGQRVASNGINVDFAEKKWGARYVGSYSIPGVGDGPYAVFYRDTLDEREIALEYDNYFGLHRGRSDEISIFNAKKIRDASFAAIEYEPGKFLVSRSVHDYVVHGPYMLDGGPFYTRCSAGHGPTHTMTIVDGNEVFTPIQKAAVPADVGPITSLEYQFEADRDRYESSFKPNGLEFLLDDVRAFHIGCDQPVLDTPTIPATPRVQLRLDLLEEEWKEYQEAVAANDLVEIADALGDMIWVICGTALEYGIRLDRVWAEINDSNMLKIDPATGKAKKFPNGKVMKPEGWKPPNIAEALGLV